MTTITSNISKIETFFFTLKSKIGGTLASNATEYTLQLDNDFGSGSIRSIILDDGIAVLEFNLKLNHDFQITIDSLLETHVNFIYCSKGKLSHSFNDNNQMNAIETFQTSIVSNIVSSKNTVFIEKEVQTVATVISVNTCFDSANSSRLNSALKKAFITSKVEDYLYIGSYNLKIAENIKDLRAIKQEGLVRGLLIKGIVNVILALEIDQHDKDLENSEKLPVSLTRKEFVLIQELTDYINKYPDLDHKIENLINKVGLSAVKIQDGFKFTHGLTICEYIRSIRLTKAEELLSNTDLNVSEVVYSLGFTSRSYFSKIFKEKFQCSPSEYKKKNKLAVPA